MPCAAADAPTTKAPNRASLPHLADDTGDHRGDTDVERKQAHAFPASPRRCRAQEGAGEVGAPHEDRVRHGTEQQQVDHEPAGLGQEGVGQGGGEEGEQPQDDATVGGHVPPHAGLHPARRPAVVADRASTATRRSTAATLSAPPACRAGSHPRRSPTATRSSNEPWRSTAGAHRADR